MDFFKVKKNFRCSIGSISPFCYTRSGMVWLRKGEILQTSVDPKYLNWELCKPLSLPQVLKLLQKNPTLLDNVKEML